MLKKLQRKLKCQKGASELVGFLVGLPMFIFLLVSFVMFVQMGMARQTLEQAAYAAARAAVVQPSRDQAQNAADTAAGAALSAAIQGMNPVVQLTEVAGVTDTGTSSGIRWEKGTLLLTEVTIRFPAFAANREIEMRSEIVMMIERPAPRYG